jgi:hypothetical protein
MKEIYQITETVDNWGGTEKYTTLTDAGTDVIMNYLTNREEWSDDVIIGFRENGNPGQCSIDDIVGEVVLVKGKEVTIPS